MKLDKIWNSGLGIVLAVLAVLIAARETAEKQQQKGSGESLRCRFLQDGL